MRNSLFLICAFSIVGLTAHAGEPFCNEVEGQFTYSRTLPGGDAGPLFEITLSKDHVFILNRPYELVRSSLKFDFTSIDLVHSSLYRRVEKGLFARPNNKSAVVDRGENQAKFQYEVDQLVDYLNSNVDKHIDRAEWINSRKGNDILNCTLKKLNDAK